MSDGIVVPRSARFKDITGQRFGRIVVKRLHGRKGRQGALTWWCLCDCGKEFEVAGTKLKAGNTTSCGCAKIDRLTKHGMSGIPEHAVWMSILQRCDNPSSPAWSYYGGRGIRVCERWREFANFLDDMGRRPSHRHSIDRIDNDGNYEPGNCRWATMQEQCRNTRRTHFITIDGETLCVEDWAIRMGTKPSTIRSRLWRRWPEHEAILGRKQSNENRS